MRTVYEMKIQLEYIKPPVWRKFLVPADIRLDRLHAIIQWVMGWSNYHLFEFMAGKIRYGKRSPYDDDFRVVSVAKTSLNEVLTKEKQKMRYIYDFGDDWLHCLQLMKIHEMEEFPAYTCLDGKRACPPEDCGSIPGYMEILEQLALPEDERDEELMDWLGDYDPDAFDLDTLNRKLRRLKVK
ncbi:MAG TPA: plasmid pRiA4b ORF-3 family protein [Patescibacteria group bacterium]|nr:plasmid pRiA4b ORF-3 family protein [Patescibacteria group bacterium]